MKLNKEQMFERIKENYEKHVIRTPNCWGWKGRINESGFARLSITRSVLTCLAHVASWLIHKGDLPKGTLLVQTCGTRSCSNPDHLALRVRTSRKNMENKLRPGRL